MYAHYIALKRFTNSRSGTDPSGPIRPWALFDIYTGRGPHHKVDGDQYVVVHEENKMTKNKENDE